MDKENQELLLLKKTARKYRTRAELKKRDKGAYFRAYRRGWLDKICSHMVKDARKSKWTPEAIKNEALKYQNKSQWIENSHASYERALELGIKDNVSQHMARKQKDSYWNKQRVIKDAKKYSSRVEWIEKNEYTYKVAIKKGWIDRCTKHMLPVRRWRKHTLESCKITAKKYTSRGQWLKRHRNSYTAAYKNGWLDQCTKHMKNNRNKKTKKWKQNHKK